MRRPGCGGSRAHPGRDPECNFGGVQIEPCIQVSRTSLISLALGYGEAEQIEFARLEGGFQQGEAVARRAEDLIPVYSHDAARAQVGVVRVTHLALDIEAVRPHFVVRLFAPCLDYRGFGLAAIKKRNRKTQADARGMLGVFLMAEKGPDLRI